jgi:hypothetical protein
MQGMVMTSADTTNPTKPVTILEIRAEGGSLTIVGIKADNAWRFRLVRNECAHFDLLNEEDRAGLVFYEESDWVSSWDQALELLNEWPLWHRLHPEHVHPEFRARVWQAVQSRSSRQRPSSWSAKMRRLVSYFTNRAVRRDRRWAKVRAREQLDRWARVCRGKPAFPVGPNTIHLPIR